MTRKPSSFYLSFSLLIIGLFGLTSWKAIKDDYLFKDSYEVFSRSDQTQAFRNTMYDQSANQVTNLMGDFSKKSKLWKENFSWGNEIGPNYWPQRALLTFSPVPLPHFTFPDLNQLTKGSLQKSSMSFSLLTSFWDEEGNQNRQEGELICPPDTDIKRSVANYSDVESLRSDSDANVEMTGRNRVDIEYQNIDSLGLLTGLRYGSRLSVRSLNGVTESGSGLVAGRGFRFQSFPDTRGWVHDSLIYLVPDNYRGRSFDPRSLSGGTRFNTFRLANSKDALVFTCTSRKGYQKPTVRGGTQLVCPRGCNLTKLNLKEGLSGKRKSLIIIPNYQK